MNKYITGTIVPCDEAITFLIIEPLYFSTQGNYHPFDADSRATSGEYCLT